ncbi:hypothetical protein EDC01DRAFT_672101 [Geopyxis carbonaria]|nr:hypothetical protein EDC01DRAFT_672101 [Geopyxis carbonaria]
MHSLQSLQFVLHALLWPALLRASALPATAVIITPSSTSTPTTVAEPKPDNEAIGKNIMTAVGGVVLGVLVLFGIVFMCGKARHRRRVREADAAAAGGTIVYRTRLELDQIPMAHYSGRSGSVRSESGSARSEVGAGSFSKEIGGGILNKETGGGGFGKETGARVRFELTPPTPLPPPAYRP